MTPRNLGIVLGPSLLWKTGGNGLHNNPTAQTDNIESILKVNCQILDQEFGYLLYGKRSKREKIFWPWERISHGPISLKIVVVGDATL